MGYRQTRALGRKRQSGVGDSAYSVFPSSKYNRQEEIGSASLCLSQISSTGEEIQGKQTLGPLPSWDLFFCTSPS